MSNDRGRTRTTSRSGATRPAPETEVIDSVSLAKDAETEQPERRFTAPSGFDAGKTQIIETAPEPATEILSVRRPRQAPPRQAPTRGRSHSPDPLRPS